ncbi:hypothetical protein NP493_344g01020 [Ridgeia piscesae]|uniref:Protein FAM92A1 n=1 Tax=Ridgeia piscesae TaxID=27915 RepID=A0AAD9L3D9_RIDPI|nr:hypothetical protein NP493_344g01020 [Ridgeia piscesae]
MHNAYSPRQGLDTEYYDQGRRVNFIKYRINQAESHLGSMCAAFSDYMVAQCKVRDCGDYIVKTLMVYAEQEYLSQTTKVAVRQFAENLSAVQDYREVDAKRLEANVVHPLSLYGAVCKTAKRNLNEAFDARKKEIQRQEVLDKARERDPTDKKTITQAENDLEQAGKLTTNTCKALDAEIDHFEEKKLTDMRDILFDFVKAEMSLHARALEMLTSCYHNLLTIDINHDTAELRRALHPEVFETYMTPAKQHKHHRITFRLKFKRWRPQKRQSKKDVNNVEIVAPPQEMPECTCKDKQKASSRNDNASGTTSSSSDDYEKRFATKTL